jgi:hypothetical protein
MALWFGSAGISYTRGVSVAGGFGGTTDSQSASASLNITSLLRGLVFSISPSYSSAESIGNSRTDQVDVWSFNLDIGAVYQLSRYVAVFGGYTFFYQRPKGSAADQIAVDQNRVRFGLQFGYPFDFN